MVSNLLQVENIQKIGSILSFIKKLKLVCKSTIKISQTAICPNISEGKIVIPSHLLNGAMRKFFQICLSAISLQITRLSSSALILSYNLGDAETFYFP